MTKPHRVMHISSHILSTRGRMATIPDWLLDRWRVFTPYVAALTIFFSSRLVIYFAIQFATRFVPRNNNSGTWDAGTNWYDKLLRWDSGWYYSILANGYRFNGDNSVQHSVNFFPLYPLIAKIVTITFGIDGYISLLLVSNTAAVLSIIALFKLVSTCFGDDIALTTVALLSFFPASLFLSAGYTESLTLMLTLCCLLLISKQHHIAAAAVAGLAVGSRAIGIVLLPVLLWELWGQQKIPRRRLFLYVPLSVLLATSGLWAYMIFLWTTVGYPLAFWTDRAAWMSSGKAVGSGLSDLLTLTPLAHALKLEDLQRLQPAELDSWFFALFVILIVIFLRRLSVSLALFGLGTLLIPYLALSGGQGFSSMTRYVFLSFPVFIIAATLLKRSSWLTSSWLGLSAVMLFVYTSLFAQWYWVE